MILIYDNIICIYDPYMTFPYGLKLSVGFAGGSGSFTPSRKCPTPVDEVAKMYPAGVEFDPSPSCTVSAVHDAAIEWRIFCRSTTERSVNAHNTKLKFNGN